MSKEIDSIKIRKINVDFSKSSKFIKESLIIYSEDKECQEFFELMKKGYMEMAKINLELAMGTHPSRKSLNYKFDDINEYEKWLCGV